MCGCAKAWDRILKRRERSQDDFIDYLASMDENGNSDYKFKGYVEDVPPQMKRWLRDNEQRILNARSLPYWIKDNPRMANSQDI